MGSHSTFHPFLSILSSRFVVARSVEFARSIVQFILQRPSHRSMAEVSAATASADSGGPKKVTTSDFDFGEILGEGAYGAVRQRFWVPMTVIPSDNPLLTCISIVTILFGRSFERQRSLLGV